MEVFHIFIFLLVIKATQSSQRGKRANHCPFSNLNITNGSYEVESGGAKLLYRCDAGFSLYGVQKLICIGSVWSNSLPKCIANTCNTLPVEKPLRARKSYGGALLTFSCEVMYKLVGDERLTCNGKTWSATTPSCERFSPPYKCDFEDPGLCDWKHHENSDVRWRLHSGDTKTSRTGPTYDHTRGVNGDGHYMYFEASEPTKRGHKAVLVSPLYPATYSGKCFTFWYHFFAEGDVSLLQLFIKPDSKTLRNASALFHIQESQGDRWLNQTLRIPVLAEPFQILFVATKGSDIRSDIAIDDISLSSCPADTGINKTQSTSQHFTEVTKQRDSNTTAMSRSFTTRMSAISRHSETLRPTSVPSISSVSKPAETLTTRLISSVSYGNATSPASGRFTSYPERILLSSDLQMTSSVSKKSATSPTPGIYTTMGKKISILTHNLKMQTSTKVETIPASGYSRYGQTTTHPIMQLSTVQNGTERSTDRNLISNTSSSTARNDRSVAKRDSEVAAYIVVGIGVGFTVVVMLVIGLYYLKRRMKRCRNDGAIGAANPIYIALKNDNHEDLVKILNNTEW